MSDRPIIFSAPMVRALLDGRKTQTRRILKAPRDVDPEHWMPNTPGRLGAGISGDRFAVLHWPNDGAAHACGKLPCQAGDRLWVRENHRFSGGRYNDGQDGVISWSEDEWFRCYGSSGPGDNWDPAFPAGWSPSAHMRVEDLTGPGHDEGPDVVRFATRLLPSIHMPRWASRLTLMVTEVRVERLQDISEMDAKAEGVEPIQDHGVGNQHLHGIAFEQLWERLHGPGSWLANPWVCAISFDCIAANIDSIARAA